MLAAGGLAMLPLDGAMATPGRSWGAITAHGGRLDARIVRGSPSCASTRSILAWFLGNPGSQVRDGWACVDSHGSALAPLHPQRGERARRRAAVPNGRHDCRPANSYKPSCFPNRTVSTRAASSVSSVVITPPVVGGRRLCVHGSGRRDQALSGVWGRRRNVSVRTACNQPLSSKKRRCEKPMISVRPDIRPPISRAVS